MINRISDYIQRAPPRPPPEQYALIEVGALFVPVYPWMGARVSAQLRRRFWSPRWITFRDIAGAEYTVRASHVIAVWTTSPEIRRKIRAFYRARDDEAEQDGL